MLFAFGLYQIYIYHDDLYGTGSKGKSGCNKKFINVCIMTAGKTAVSHHEIYSRRDTSISID
ncbi:hypothetical protein CGL57_17905 [Edwardsiella anguillarum]|nr:hypothetical protein CGL57_17905 [Edwardsiella anguillarum]